jgi:HAD superfamily hydrolase (TIGR01509 family)
MTYSKNSRAIIFDFDGVVVDSMAAKSKSVVKVLKDFFGVNYDPQEFVSKFAGGKIDLSVKEILRENKVEFTEYDIGKAVASREEMVNQELIRGNIPLIPGVRELLVDLKKEDYHLGIASGSRQEFIGELLKKHQIDNYFLSVVSAFDKNIPKPKPDPAIFLQCGKNLGVPPQNCLVLEDGLLGMLAAKRAKMKCVALVKEITSEYDFVDLQITELRELNLKRVGEIMSSG